MRRVIEIVTRLQSKQKLSHPKVLVASSNADELGQLQTALCKCGCVVTSAGKGIPTEKPDLFVCNLEFKENGASNLISLAYDAQIPVLLIQEMICCESLQAQQKLGWVGWVQKPLLNESGAVIAPMVGRYWL